MHNAEAVDHPDDRVDLAVRWRGAFGRHDLLVLDAGGKGMPPEANLASKAVECGPEPSRENKDLAELLPGGHPDWCGV
eukprot:6264099-Prymnesium_polylepis.4